MPKVHIVGRMQLDENPRKRPATPEDYTSMAEGALRNGNDFYQAALTYGIHNPQRAALGVALTCNLVFAAELYLKALIYSSGRKPPYGHNLEALFQAIKDEERDEVIASCLSCLGGGTPRSSGSRSTR